MSNHPPRRLPQTDCFPTIFSRRGSWDIFNEVVVLWVRCRPGFSFTRAQLSVANAAEMVHHEVVCHVQTFTGQKIYCHWNHLISDTHEDTNVHEHTQCMYGISIEACWRLSGFVFFMHYYRYRILKTLRQLQYAATVFRWSIRTVSVWSCRWSI